MRNVTFTEKRFNFTNPVNYSVSANHDSPSHQRVHNQQQRITNTELGKILVVSRDSLQVI